MTFLWIIFIAEAALVAAICLFILWERLWKPVFQTPSARDGKREKAPFEGRCREVLLTCEELDYWGERFQELKVGTMAGCSFEQYLRRPIYYERIAGARRELANTLAS